MGCEVTVSRGLLTAEERSAIAEIEATTNVLRLVTRLTGMRFAGIAKFTEAEWVACSVYDPSHLGMEEGAAFDLEQTLCNEFRTNSQALFVPQISQNGKYANLAVVKQYEIESYAGVPIFLPDGRLYGALCALDSRLTLFDDPDLAETLGLFARLVGCIFFSNLTEGEYRA
ncbi:GAF domain-containing protein [Pseudomonas floridensis]|uniref:GAF domain-containing protein n=1 Tax=Pseudomonas floridensis TaxID=1958950 RepID=A0A1X0NE02_9PSED|nr:GAF domain-containing protein [Pseudomonas floridensis]ORC62276.1 GAF domain-containing protein [Pseudomonas floridensis]